MSHLCKVREPHNRLTAHCALKHNGERNLSSREVPFWVLTPENGRK